MFKTKKEEKTSEKKVKTVLKKKEEPIQEMPKEIGFLPELADFLEDYLLESAEQILTKLREIPCPGEGKIMLVVERTPEIDVLRGFGEIH